MNSDYRFLNLLKPQFIKVAMLWNTENILYNSYNYETVISRAPHEVQWTWRVYLVAYLKNVCADE